MLISSIKRFETCIYFITAAVVDMSVIFTLMFTRTISNVIVYVGYAIGDWSLFYRI